MMLEVRAHLPFNYYCKEKMANEYINKQVQRILQFPDNESVISDALYRVGTYLDMIPPTVHSADKMTVEQQTAISEYLHRGGYLLPLIPKTK